jgi:hypothetical protein
METTSTILTIVVGCLMIIFRGQFARNSLRFQKKVFGVNYGVKEQKLGALFIPLVGIVFVSVGVFGLISTIGSRI